MRDVPEYLPPEDPDPAEETPRRRPAPLRSRRVAIAGGLAAALLLGGIGVAVAQSTSSPSTTTPPAAGAPTVPGAPGAPGGPGGPGGRMHGHGGPGFAKGGPMGALHGEFVTRNGANGFRTIDTQVGQVTSVSQDAITVKSEDGFTKTYAVDQNTVVNSGRDGIGNVKNGDTVRVNAVVENGKAQATDIRDETTLGNIRQHWAPAAPAPSAQ